MKPDKEFIQKEILEIINRSSVYQFQSCNDTDSNNYTLLMAALYMSNKIKLNSIQWDYLLVNSNLAYQDYHAATPLIIAICNYKKSRLSDKQWDCLIERSPLEVLDHNDWDALCWSIWVNPNNEKKITTKIIEASLKNNPDFFNEKYFANLDLRSDLVAEMKRLIDMFRIHKIKTTTEIELINRKPAKQNKI